MAQANNVDGAWSPLANWPLISIHAALTPDRRVLTYGTDGTGKQTGYFIYDVWDPAAGALDLGHMTLDNLTTTDIFCSSQIILPQSGEILISGGDNWTGSGTTNTGNNNSNIFDYGNNTLAQSANLNRSRWYSSSTALVNGEIYIQGGNGGGDFPEVRDTGGAFRLLTGAPTGGYAATFPRNFLAPDGRIFGYDTNGKMYFVSTGGTGSLAAVGQFPSSNAGWTSSAAMYRPGKILQMGGNSNLAMIIDINGPQPTWMATQPMATKRQWVSATVMADGQVLATNGSEIDNQLTGVNTNAEIWNPNTGQWHVGSAGVPARMYHSSALLLPDGSVLVAGGGAPGPLVNTNAEIYYPSYLFNGIGGFATRPQIVTAPDTANVGDNLAVQVDSTISRVTLVKSGSVTHSVNMDQRFLELSFTQSGNMLGVSLPVRATDTPPGYYLMFAIDNAGVPSVAQMLRINIDSNPNTAVDYTQTIGGGGGGPFQLTCPADEIVVGVRGNYATYVNQIGAQCVKVDQLGRWIGNPVNGSVTGTTTTGTSFTKTCPQDFAISGFQGRSDQYVNQLDFECRALTGIGGLTGASQFLGAVGGNGGTARGPFSCGTNNPVYALYGRSGGWLDSFGVQCRLAVITPISINSLPVVVNPGTQNGTVGIAVNLPISASDGDLDELTFSETGLPDGLQIDPSNGLITGTPTTTGTFNVTVTVSDGTDIDTADFIWTMAVALPLSVDPMPPQPPQLANTVVNYTASAHNGLNIMYKWNFGDGTLETVESSLASIAHTFTDAGVYNVTLTVHDDFDNPPPLTFVQTIHLPLTVNSPASSTKIAYEEKSGTNSRVWVVNQDNDSVTVFDAVTDTKLTEIAVDTAPRSVAIAPDGRVWVTNKSSASISIIDPVSLTVVDTLAMPLASQPYGVVFSPIANEAFVVLEATGQLLKLHASTGAELASVDVGPHVRGVATNGAGTALYVSRFVTPRQPGEETATVASEVGGVKHGGQVIVVDSAAMTILRTIVFEHSALPDAENQGSGVPNYLGAVAISPDGTFASVPSKQDNIGRGTLRNLLNINFQNTVRAIGSFVDTTTDTEVHSQRIDFDNSSIAGATVFDPVGIYMFVSLETSREVAVVDAYGKLELFRIPTGRTPQGLTISADGLKLFVTNFMDRSLGVYDLTELQTTGQFNVPLLATLQSVSSETLSPQVLLGKQFFYDAWDTRLARDKYLSCAACHNEGGQDGRVWDLTGMGEGLRNTINLKGTGADHGRLHWSENFDEIQDFEGQIRALSEGTGLMADVDFDAGTTNQPLGDPKAGISADLDALAAYVASLNEFANSPHRNGDSSLTADAVIGRAIFQRENCAACHTGVEFTDSDTNILHDIGTLKPSSGTRLGGPDPIPGIDTPTLRGVWDSAPYLHDGSAETIADAVAAHDTVLLNETDMTSLVAYLEQIDTNEVSAPLPNTPPTLSNPGPQAAETGSSVGLAMLASDADSDPLNYAASGLPAGLTIDALSGVISGTPSTAGSSNVTVTVDDGTDSVSVSFSWDITVPNTPPTLSNPGPQAAETGSSVGLAMLASDADSDPLNYAATDLPAGLTIDALSGVISGTPSTAGSSNVTVTVDDGTDSVSVSFSWDITLPSTPPPQAPDNLSASAVSENQIDLQWSDNAANETGFELERSTDGLSWSGLATVGANTTVYADSGLLASTTYYYRVRAYNGGGSSGWSNTGNAETLAPPPPPPPAPSPLTATAVSGQRIDLAWTDVANEDGYRLERSTDGFSFSLIASPAANQSSYSDTGLSAATTYFYRVTAFNGSGDSPAADTSAATPSIVEHTAVAESTTYGTVTGSYADTAIDDGVAERIAETESGGKKPNRHTRLEHRWQFNIGSGTSALLIANAWKSGNAEDDFSFEYSTDTISYSALFIVSSTDVANEQVLLLPGGISGTVYVRVMDTDRNAGNHSIEELHVDHLYIQVEAGNVGSPPVAPTNLSAVPVSASQVDLSWTDLSDDEFGFDIERSTNGGSSWQSIATAPANSTAYSDTTVIGDVFYDYRVNASNAAGSSAWDGPVTVQTPVGVGVVLAAAGYKVKGTQHVDLSWTGGPAQSWDIYRQGTFITTVSSGESGNYTDIIGTKGGGSYTYQMCEAGGTSSCSNEVTVVF